MDAISRLREKAQNEATCIALNNECRLLRQQLAECQSKWEHFENSVAEKSMQCLSLEKELAECQRDAKRLHVEIHDQAAEIAGDHAMLKFKDEQLATVTKERDAYKAKAVIADIPMSDVEARLKEQLATVTKERDELKANSDRYELLRDMKLYEMQQYNYLPCALEDSYDWFDEQTDAKIRERYPRATIGADKAGEG